MDQDLQSVLLSAPLFSQLRPEQLDELVGPVDIKRYPRGTEIIRVGEPADAFLVVLSGAVKVYLLSPDGREHILHMVQPGGLVAEAAVFAQGTYPASTMATEDSTVAMVRRARVTDLLQRDPEVGLAMVAGLSRRLREFVSVIEDLSLRDVASRLARFILENSTDGRCRLPGTKTELAAQLGTVLEPLSRALRKLKERGTIDEQSGVIEVIDRDALEDLLLGT